MTPAQERWSRPPPKNKWTTAPSLQQLHPQSSNMRLPIGHFLVPWRNRRGSLIVFSPKARPAAHARIFSFSGSVLQNYNMPRPKRRKDHSVDSLATVAIHWNPGRIAMRGRSPTHVRRFRDPKILPPSSRGTGKLRKEIQGRPRS